MSVRYEVDHIIPEARGGATISENLAYSCPLCNEFKGARTHGTDPQTEKRYPLFHPRKQNWFRHFSWSSDGFTIVGRTASGRATVETLQMNSDDLKRLRFLWRALGANPPDWHCPLLDGYSMHFTTE